MTSAPPPVGFMASIASYEDWMRARLGPLIVEADLRAKHRRMRADAFLFLRGTCWRWAETAGFIAPALNDGPVVASVGDAHAGNFGLWRDAEGRLVWGANDFDEAATIPYRMDLTRLVTSATLARKDASPDDGVAEAAIDGYAAGLSDPRPYVLEQDHVWLRDAFSAGDHERSQFWAKLRGSKPATEVSDAYRSALNSALPPASASVELLRRRAGVGSLGRPRIVALTDDVGGPIAREAKALLPSCWDRDAPVGGGFGLATGRYRCPDPFLHVTEEIVVRRLAPNSRKIDVGGHGKRVRRRLIGAMARDVGAIHAADIEAASAILEHLRAEGHDWLSRSSTAMTEATMRDWHEFRDATDEDGDHMKP